MLFLLNKCMNKLLAKDAIDSRSDTDTVNGPTGVIKVVYDACEKHRHELENLLKILGAGLAAVCFQYGLEQSSVARFDSIAKAEAEQKAQEILRTQYLRDSTEISEFLDSAESETLAIGFAILEDLGKGQDLPRLYDYIEDDNKNPENMADVILSVDTIIRNALHVRMQRTPYLLESLVRSQVSNNEEDILTDLSVLQQRNQDLIPYKPYLDLCAKLTKMRHSLQYQTQSSSIDQNEFQRMKKGAEDLLKQLSLRFPHQGLALDYRPGKNAPKKSEAEIRDEKLLHQKQVASYLEGIEKDVLEVTRAVCELHGIDSKKMSETLPSYEFFGTEHLMLIGLMQKDMHEKTLKETGQRSRENIWVAASRTKVLSTTPEFKAFKKCRELYDAVSEIQEIQRELPYGQLRKHELAAQKKEVTRLLSQINEKEFDQE